jgi:hypothetical protein
MVEPCHAQDAALAVDQGAGTPVTVAGQLGNLLADFGQQLGIALVCSPLATIVPVVLAMV